MMQVIVVNAQIVVDALSHKIIDETMFALIVIDECHHCLGSQHPYRQLTTRLKKFKRESNSDCFRIIGLTSCALNRTVTAETIAERITLLENILGAKIISSDAVIQSSNPDSGEYDFTVLNKLEVFLHSLGDFDNATDSRGFILDCIRRVKGVMEDCGIYCAYKSAVQCAKKLKSMDDINSEDNMIILRIATTAFESFCFPLHSKLSRCHKFEAIFPYLSRQVILILESLEKFHDILTAKQLSLTAIVFLERKCSVV
uniref:Helicase ATP-binding domain-containing protein n=1 Tax=Panagrolaimus sp. JU765 TaxID=591449 RepID=A0AC34RBU2_9BILA